MSFYKVLLFIHILSNTTFGIEIPSGATVNHNPTFQHPSGEGPGPDLKNGNHMIHNDYSAFMGKIFPILSKLVITPPKAKAIFDAWKAQVNPGDLYIILFLGWILLPLIKVPYEKGVSIAINKRKNNSQNYGWEERKMYLPSKFDKTLGFQIVDLISAAGKVAGLVYVVDCLFILFQTLGFDTKGLNHIFAKVLYTVWFWKRIMHWKTIFIFKLFHVPTTDFDLEFNSVIVGRATIVSKILDVLIVTVMISSVLDVLQLQTGLAVKSFLTVGSAGTLLISYASKDIASEFVQGLALSTSDKVYEGEKADFGGGLAGTIVHMGWMETVIRTSDERFLRVPNSKLSSQLVTNLSRQKNSQVQQTLRFNYNDIDKLPKTLQDITDEIKNTCPSAITDGTRAFRAVFVDYKPTHLEVNLDVRFKCPPACDLYWNTRQRCLLAVDRAVKKNGMKFVVLKEDIILK